MNNRKSKELEELEDLDDGKHISPQLTPDQVKRNEWIKERRRQGYLNREINKQKKVTDIIEVIAKAFGYQVEVKLK